jgi:phosphate transport system substrate-binding protein
MSTLVRSRLLSVALSAFLLFTGCARNTKNSVVLAGSTSVEPFAELLGELYTARQHKAKPPVEVEINVQGGGSSAGVRAVQNGICQIGMSSRTLTAEEKGLIEIPVAIDGIVIIINRNNPVQSVTIEQARAIFAGDVRRWDELGGTRRAITVITREEGSGTRASFEEKVMIGDSKTASPFSRDALVQDSNGAVREIVAGDPNAIGYISFGLVDDRVRPLVLDGVAPAEGTIKQGTYPITRKFLFLSKGEPTGIAKDFIDYVLSPDGQNALAGEGLVKVN